MDIMLGLTAAAALLLLIYLTTALLRPEWF